MVARNRVVLIGSMGSPVVESFQVGLHYAGPTGETVNGQAALDTWAVGLATLLGAGETDYPILTGLLGTGQIINRVRVYSYGAGLEATGVSEAAFDWSGTGTVRGSFSQAQVFTLLTLTPGKSYRGRSYWPVPAAQPNGSGGIGTAAGTATEFAELLSDIAAAAPVPGLRPVVYSATKNVVTTVTSVRVGNVPDHQRRRVQNVPEVFQSAPVL